MEIPPVSLFFKEIRHIVTNTLTKFVIELFRISPCNLIFPESRVDEESRIGDGRHRRLGMSNDGPPTDNSDAIGQCTILNKCHSYILDHLHPRSVLLSRIDSRYCFLPLQHRGCNSGVLKLA